MLADIAMSSNITDVKYGMFSAEFIWDGAEPHTSVFLKFFVASTDFTGIHNYLPFLYSLLILLSFIYIPSFLIYFTVFILFSD